MKSLKLWRIIAPLILLLTLSGCLGGLFERPDYPSLVVDSIEKVNDGIRITIHNIGTSKAQVTSVRLFAENSLGQDIGEEEPVSKQNDGTWFRGVETEENPPNDPHQFILPDSIVEGWAFEDTPGIASVRINISWTGSGFVGNLSDRRYPVPYYRTGDQTWEDDDEF